MANCGFSASSSLCGSRVIFIGAIRFAGVGSIYQAIYDVLICWSPWENDA